MVSVYLLFSQIWGQFKVKCVIGNVGKYAVDTVENSKNTLEPATCPRCQWENMQQFVFNVRSPTIPTSYVFLIICCWGGLEENVLTRMES